LQASSQPTTSTSFPRTWPCSLTRCASATSASGKVCATGSEKRPDSITSVSCATVLVEGAELIVWASDRRRARLHPDPYAGLADDELSPADLEDAEIGDNMFG
jgi:hypothetical protein